MLTYLGSQCVYIFERIFINYVINNIGGMENC